jgi:diadenosine tetraphosphate (Ap4A) HIT family hydrolase
MGKFQLHYLTKPRFAKLWKLLALFSSRIMGVAKAYDFGSRKGKSAKDVDSHSHQIPRSQSKGRFIETASKKPFSHGATEQPARCPIAPSWRRAWRSSPRLISPH